MAPPPPPPPPHPDSDGSVMEKLVVDVAELAGRLSYCRACDAGPFTDIRAVKAHVASKLHQKRAAASGNSDCLMSCDLAGAGMRRASELTPEDIEHLPEYVDVNFVKEGKLVCLLCRSESSTLAAMQFHLGSVNHTRSCERLGYPLLVFSPTRHRLELKESGSLVSRSEDSQHAPEPVARARKSKSARPQHPHGKEHRHAARSHSPPPSASTQSTSWSPGSCSTSSGGDVSSCASSSSRPLVDPETQHHEDTLKPLSECEAPLDLPEPEGSICTEAALVPCESQVNACCGHESPPAATKLDVKDKSLEPSAAITASSNNSAFSKSSVDGSRDISRQDSSHRQPSNSLTEQPRSRTALPALVGQWQDTSGSCYDVTPCDARSLTVLTFRPTGQVMHSQALIRLHPDGKVTWGSRENYQLEALVPNQHNLVSTVNWLPNAKDQKPFRWIRLQISKNRRGVSKPAEVATASAEVATGVQLGQRAVMQDTEVVGQDVVTQAESSRLAARDAETVGHTVICTADDEGATDGDSKCNVTPDVMQCGDTVTAQMRVTSPPAGFSHENFLIPIEIGEVVTVAYIEDDWFWGVIGARQGWAPNASFEIKICAAD